MTAPYEGWSIRSTFLEAVLKGTEPSTDALLNADLREIGIGCLSEEIAKGNDFVIKEQYILQLVSMRDISQPLQKDGEESHSGRRLMLIVLTDGRMPIRCLDDQKGHATSIPSELPPGTKIRLRSGHVRNRIMMLDSGSLEVLGGRVAGLAEEWEFQQSYGTKRLAEVGEIQAPKFEQYDPRQPPPKIHLGSFSTAAVLNHCTETQEDQSTSSRLSLPTTNANAFGNREEVRIRLMAEMPSPSTSRAPHTVQRRKGMGQRNNVPQSSSHTLTLEEYEARRHSTTVASGDEAIARQLDEEINGPPIHQSHDNAEKELMTAMFSYTPTQEPSPQHRPRGRGRGRGRGGRRGRGRR